MNEVNHLFKKLFSKDEEDIGFSEKEILAAEKRLGIKLPKLIRDFYLTQVRNILINSCHDFARPEQLGIDNNKWLLFYGENQGIWGCAINLEERENIGLKVYINYEQQGYEEEAKSFKDFLIIRATCDYGNYIYPHSVIADNVSKKDFEIIANKLGEPKSEITPPNYNFKRRLYWDNEDEVIQIFEWKNNVYNGRKFIFVQSFNNDCFEKYYNMNENVEWKVLSRNRIKEKVNLTPYIEKRENFEEIEVSLDSKNFKDGKGGDFDLPF